MKKRALALFAAAEYLAERHIGWILLLYLTNYFTIVWQNYTQYHDTQLVVLFLDGIFLFFGVCIYVILLACIPWRMVRTALLSLSAVLSASLAGLEIFAITT